LTRSRGAREKAIDTADHEITVDLEKAGLDPGETYLAFEFWTQQFLGEVTGELSLDVPADTPRVVFLRKRLPHPQFIGTNRHVLGGVGVIRSLVWVDAISTLNGTQEGSVGTTYAPFTNQVTFYVPDGSSAEQADVIAPEGYEIQNKTLDVDGNVATLCFDVIELDGACPPDEPCMHPVVTWSVKFSTGCRLSVEAGYQIFVRPSRAKRAYSFVSTARSRT